MYSFVGTIREKNPSSVELRKASLTMESQFVLPLPLLDPITGFQLLLSVSNANPLLIFKQTPMIVLSLNGFNIQLFIKFADLWHQVIYYLRTIFAITIFERACFHLKRTLTITQCHQMSICIYCLVPQYNASVHWASGSPNLSTIVVRTSEFVVHTTR